MTPTIKQYVECFFEHDGNGVYKCKIDGCNVKRKKPTGSGYGNVMQHLLSAHPNFKFDFENDMQKLCYNYPEKVISAYKWIDWIVINDLPFSFVDNERTRKNASIKSISRQTLTKNLSQLTKLLENEVRASLPSCFGHGIWPPMRILCTHYFLNKQFANYRVAIQIYPRMKKCLDQIRCG